MPKRKGRLRGALPQGPTPTAADQTPMASSVVPLGASMSGAEKSPRPGSDASLSPGGPIPPPTPAKTADVQGDFQAPEGLLVNAEESARLTEDIVGQTLTWELKSSDLQTVNKKLPTQSESEAKKVSTALDLKSLTDFPQLTKPAEVSLDNIWKGLELLHSLCSIIAKQTCSTAGELNELKISTGDHQKRIIQLEKQQGQTESFKFEITHDTLILHRKVENLENANRSLNLRLVNFPFSRIVHPKEMFFKYLKEVLQYEDTAMPLLHKIYYIPKRISQQEQELSPAPLDVSAVLEQSVEEIQKRETLLIAFAFNTDKELLLKKYFKKLNCTFLGGTIRIYPDVSGRSIEESNFQV